MIVDFRFAKTCLAVLTVTASTFALGQALKPVIPIEKASLRKLPLMEVVFRDPKQELKVNNAEEAEDALEEVKDIDEDFPAADPEDKLRLASEALRYYLGLLYYHEDIELGRGKGKRVAQTPALRAKLIEYSKALMEMAKDAALKDRAKYHFFVQSFLNGKENEVATGLSKKSSEVAADSPYRNNLLLLAAIAALGEANPDNGIAKINKLSTGLEKEALFIALLAQARAIAGFDLLGKKARDTKPTYNTYLYKAVLFAEEYSDTVKEEVLAFAMALWMGAEGSNINWEKVPFSLSPFEDFSELDAINERRAYRLFDSGRQAEGVEALAKLLPAYEDSEELGPLTDRYLKMLGQVAKKSGKYDPYLEALHRADRDFRSANVLGAGNEETAKKYGKKFHNLFHLYVLQSLKTAKATSVRPELRANALKAATLFLSVTDGPKEKVRIMNEIANLHNLNKDYSKAVDTYLDIVKISKADQKLAFIGKAIDSQRILAPWPKQPPWGKDYPGDQAARKKLITLYQMAIKKGANSWMVFAHIGLLQKANGSLEDTFNTWLPRLGIDSQNPHASLAAGMMMGHYFEQKKWKELINVSQKVLKHNVAPRHKGKALDPNMYLAEALYNGGNEAMQKKEQKLALKYFRMFKTSFKDDKRAPEILFKTGLVYNEMRDQKKFVLTMKSVVHRHKDSPFSKEAIKKGIELSKDDSDKVYFLEAFLKRTPLDSEATAMREQLAKIYLKLTMSAKAIGVYEDQEKDKRTKPEAKIALNLKIMELAEKHGHAKAGLEAAERITKLPNAGQAPLAKAYALFAKFFFEKKQFDRIENYAKMMEKFNASNKDVADSLAQVRYYIAVRHAAKPQPMPDPKTIKDPNKEIQNQVVGFQELKSHFDRVCELGATDSCKQAKQDLSAVAKRSHDNISAINMAQAPDNKTLKEFGARKKKVLDTISNYILRTAH